MMCQPGISFQRNNSNTHRIVIDALHSLYDRFYLNFSSSIPRLFLEDFASGTLNRISKVHDQYLEFVTLEDNLFSLSKKSTYVKLNDPSTGIKRLGIL